MDSTAVTAIAGLAATVAVSLVVPLISGRVSDRNAERAKNHDLRVAAYVEATAYAQAVAASASSMLDPAPLRTRADLPRRAERDAPAARIELLASKAVIVGWREFVRMDDRFREHIHDHFPEGVLDQDGLPVDDVERASLEAAFNRLMEALRRDVRIG